MMAELREPRVNGRRRERGKVGRWSHSQVEASL
jgi:hypothetical protein